MLEGLTTDALSGLSKHPQGSRVLEAAVMTGAQVDHARFRGLIALRCVDLGFVA